MSNNQNRPPLRLPSSPPPGVPVAPPSGLPAEAAALLDAFPLPWVVGPHGDIWVSADVEQFDPEKEASTEKIRGPNGTWWRSTGTKARLVMEEPGSNGIAALIVYAANRLVS